VSDFRQLPRERTAITGFARRLAGHSGELGKALARWSRRADGPDPDARQAADTAIGEIDAMTRELRTLRQALAIEICASDDDGAVRQAGQLLPRSRAAVPGRTAEDDDSWLYQ